jgi:superfamily I DNA/RNA helicase
MAFLFSSQQAAVIAAAQTKGNLIVSARAGTGKTNTMIQGVCKELSKVSSSIAFVAYGKAIAAEGKDKIKELNLHHKVTVSTCHSLGLNAFKRAFRCTVNGYKLEDIARRDFNGEYQSWRTFVTAAAEKAKDLGFGILCAIDDTSKWNHMIEKYNLADLLPEDVSIERGIHAAQHMLNESNLDTSIIDYADMIYLPLLRNVKIWQYDYVIVDECQDTNPTRRELVRRMLKPNTGKLIAVGDPHQAIFAFTGADHDSMDIIEREFNAKVMPLSVTYRCPKSIVAVANRWVSDIQAHKDAPDGVVDTCQLSEVAKLAGQNDAIICRVTKPLIEMAYSLLRQSVACKVEGRAIGEGLITLARRWKSVKNVGELDAKLDTWQENEIRKAKAKNNDNRCQVIEDQAETLRVFMAQCEDSDSIATLTGKIDALFGDKVKGVLTLSTIHKTKGREWDRVFALGMQTYSPSKWAKQSWELVQEDNLQYVQVTRAKSHLTMVNVPAKVS